MKWLHNLLRGFSLTGALFVFQACYGIPEPPLYSDGGEAPMTFTLVSGDTGTPLEGISIKYNYTESNQIIYDLGVTDANGKARVYIPYRRNLEGPFIRFEDPDGQFAAKDTVLLDLRDRDITVKLDSSL